MTRRKTDIAVIGAGTAGLTAFHEAVRQGGDAVLIEGGPYGTTCARVGCMPSKLLIAAANAARAVDDAPAFGVDVAPPRVDGERVMERVRAERDRFVAYVVKSVEKIDDERKIRGWARFVDSNTLEIDGEEALEFTSAVIATGVKSNIPLFLNAAAGRVDTNEDVFYWESLPESLAVVGAGPIGLEIGQAMRRLGVRVTVMSNGTFMPFLKDEAVIESGIQIFSDELPFSLDAEPEVVENGEAGVVIEFNAPDGVRRRETFERVLAAAGTIPAVDQLDLAAAGLELNQDGTPVHNEFTMRCGDSSIFIAGDVTGDRPLLHEANHEGRVAGRNAAHFPDVTAEPRKARLSVVFTEPQISAVGEDVKTAGETHCVVVGEKSMKNQARSRVMNRDRGILRVYAEYGTGLFLGAEMIGPEAEHLGHLLAWARQCRLTVAEILALPIYHPVVEEAFDSAFSDANDKLNTRHPCRGPSLVNGPEDEG